MIEAGARPRSVVVLAVAGSKWLASLPAQKMASATAISTCGNSAKAAGAAAAARAGGDGAARAESVAPRKENHTVANEAKARMPKGEVPAAGP